MRIVPIQTSLEQTVPSGLLWFQRFGNAFIDLLFPSRCVACHRLGDWLCASCADQIEVIRPPLCHRCGMPLSGPIPPATQDGLTVCAGCKSSTRSLDGLVAYAFHSDPLRQAIHQFKYADLRSLAAPLGKLMAQGWSELTPPGCEIDAVVPVPLHVKRLRERGYNQAALLARELASHLGRPVVEDVLVRTRATAPQVDLNAKERQSNVKDAFRCLKDSLETRRVMLVDDVCTTGSTLEAAAEALRESGVSFVWAYTLARAR